ncbi:MAG: acyl-CoA dehydrogenase family protein, partial [Frankia sp.]
MPAERLLPTDEARELLGLVADITDQELEPRASIDEAASQFPRKAFTVMGRAGLLGLPFSEEVGGHQRGGEMQRRHGSKGIASKDIVKARPAVTPELLAVLDH